MSFRREGKKAHAEQHEWTSWNRKYSTLIAECGLPPGVLKSKRDWKYLLKYGYWCDGPYGKHINKIDFTLEELTGKRLLAFCRLLDAALTEEEKQRGNAAWHYVNGVTRPTPQFPKGDR
jgi:hypothetical protein